MEVSSTFVFPFPVSFRGSYRVPQWGSRNYFWLGQGSTHIRPSSWLGVDDVVFQTALPLEHANGHFVCAPVLSRRIPHTGIQVYCKRCDYGRLRTRGLTPV